MTEQNNQQETVSPETSAGMTSGVRDLIGNPKKALIKISIPVIISLVFQSIYNVTDTLWVSGIGADALAAVGLAFPYFMIMMGISMGIGVGAGSGISRAIGERDQDKASRISAHAFVLSVLCSLVFLVFIPFMGDIYEAMGTDEVLTKLAADYTNILIASSLFIFVGNVGNSILRGEGDTKRAMYATLAGVILNIVLDPIFIYDFGLGLGVNGAAYATAISIVISAVPIIYWLLIRKDTYVQTTFRKFRFEKPILKDIVDIGIPASVSQITMSLSMILLNSIILIIAGTDGTATFTTGWRIISIGIMPLLGLAAGLTSLVGVSYGEKNIRKMKDIYYYSLKVGFLFELVAAIIITALAGPITYIFTMSDGSVHLYDSIVYFLRVMFVFYLILPANVLTGSLFQGAGLGKWSFVTILLRTVIEIPFAYVISIVLGYGIIGVYIGLLLGDFVSAVLSFLLGRYVINSLRRVMGDSQKTFEGSSE